VHCQDWCIEAICNFFLIIVLCLCALIINAAIHILNVLLPMGVCKSFHLSELSPQIEYM
jgi:hypothetical protein